MHGFYPRHVPTLTDLHFQISALNHDQQINNDHSTKKVLASTQGGLNMLNVMQGEAE